VYKQFRNIVLVVLFQVSLINGTRAQTDIVSSLAAISEKIYLQLDGKVYTTGNNFLIHWNPEIVTGKEGKAAVKYYNADNTGEMLIVVEAISETGQIGYREFSYRVISNP